MPEWFFDARVQDAIPLVIGGIVLFVFWLISIKMWRAIFGHRVRAIGVESGMQFHDLDAMRKKGLISEDEYKRIRSTMAKRETERMSDEKRAEEERRIMLEAQYNPDAARKLLTQEQIGAAQSKPAQAPQPKSQAPQPSMNNPRVVRARNEARAGAQAEAGAPPTQAEQAGPGKSRDIDLLLEKGAITREEYDRLKKFFE